MCHIDHDHHHDEPSARRRFLRAGALGAAFFTIVPRGLRAQGSACDTTARDFYGLGPFYSAGAPTRTVIAGPEEPGQRLFLNGTVYANDCLTPMKDVVLDIWQADDTGCYGRFENCPNPTGDDYKLRGIIRTGESGTFGLETIKPGHYLNGSQYRPAHIHLIVRHPEISNLITQLYFEGDPYIAIDAAASRPDAAGRIIPLETRDDGLHGVIDIVLNIEPSSGAADTAYNGGAMLRQNHPNPFDATTRIPFRLNAPCAARIVLYDLSGERIATLLDRRMEPGDHVVDWDRITADGSRAAAGSYICRLEVGEEMYSRVMTAE